MAAIFRRFLTYGGLERWIDPLAPAAVEQPPGALMETYRFFLQPVSWLIITTLVVSLVASTTELAMFAFLGSLVDRMAASTPERFVRDNLWLLAAMGFVILVARPILRHLVARARQFVDHAEPLRARPLADLPLRAPAEPRLLPGRLRRAHQPESDADGHGAARERGERHRRRLVPARLSRRHTVDVRRLRLASDAAADRMARRLCRGHLLARATGAGALDRHVGGEFRVSPAGSSMDSPTSFR